MVLKHSLIVKRHRYRGMSQAIQRAIEPAIAAALDPFKTEPPGQIDALRAKHPHLGVFETVRHQAEPEASRHHRKRPRIAVGLRDDAWPHLPRVENPRCRLQLFAV